MFEDLFEPCAECFTVSFVNRSSQERWTKWNQNFNQQYKQRHVKHRHDRGQHSQTKVTSRFFNMSKLSKPALTKASKTPVDRIPDLARATDVPAHHVSDDKCTFAILDTGASRCIIGSSILSKLVRRLPADIRDNLKERPSQIRFRFGNNQTLTSQKRIHFPLKSSQHERVWLGVEVVEGSTPFLFSKRAFKQLGGVLDSTADRCTFRRLQKSFELDTNATGLYVMDINEFCTDKISDTAAVDSFVGHTCHVGSVTCHVEGQSKSQPEPAQVSSKFRHPNASQKFPSTDFVIPKPVYQAAKPEITSDSSVASLGPKPQQSPAVDRVPVDPNGHPCSDRCDVEGSSQCNRGDSHVAAATDHADVGSIRPRCRRDSSTCDAPTAGIHVCRTDSSAKHASGDRGTSKELYVGASGTVGSPSSRTWRRASRSRGRFLLRGQCSSVEHIQEGNNKSSSIPKPSFGDCGHSFEFSSLCKRGRSRQPRSPFTIHTTIDPGPVGSKESGLGKEAHRQDLLPGDHRGPELSGLVPSSLSVPVSRAEGLRGLCLRPTGARCDGGPESAKDNDSPILSAICTVDQLDPMIALEIEDCKLACSKFTSVQAADVFSEISESSTRYSNQSGRPGSC